jgi:endonuclease G
MEFGRPSLLIRHGKIELPDSAAIRKRLQKARIALERRLSSVGRIEVNAAPEAPNWGTGWVIADNVIVTNRHVAEQFAARRGKTIRWRRTPSGDDMVPCIDFFEEYSGAPDFEVDVDRVLFLAANGEDDPDIALMHLRHATALPAPIPLAEKDPLDGADIAVVGYPARDDLGRGSTPEMAARIFGDIYDVKRLAPGKVQDSQRRNKRQWFFTHDATTLGGNSGSVVLDMDSGAAAGLHFGGITLQSNHAVKAGALKKLLRSVKLQVAVPELPWVPQGSKESIAPTAETPASLASRKGYSDTFLGTGASKKVPLPKLTTRKVDGAKVSADAITFGSNKEKVLRYTHFSVVMRKSRRLCYFSAVNIHGKNSVAIRGSRPRWRADGRIGKDLQIIKECYGDVQDGKFAHGHMTRREDPNWGPDAITANADTFFVTNACPQIQPFNAGIWNDLEDYALQNSRQDDMKISVMTGPFFSAEDPEYFDVRVPLSFWKVIAFIHDDTSKLCATGYTMSQQAMLPEREFVFGQFRTYQESIAVIEEDTGLDFGKLADLDAYRVRPEGPATPLLSMEQIRWV